MAPDNIAFALGQESAIDRGHFPEKQRQRRHVKSRPKKQEQYPIAVEEMLAIEEQTTDMAPCQSSLVEAAGKLRLLQLRAWESRPPLVHSHTILFAIEKALSTL